MSEVHRAIAGLVSDRATQRTTVSVLALLDALRTAAGEQAGAPWPDYTPRVRRRPGRCP